MTHEAVALAERLKVFLQWSGWYGTSPEKLAIPIANEPPLDARHTVVKIIESALATVAQEATTTLKAEVARLSELLWGARCVYCNEVVGAGERNQDIGDDVLKQHIKSCPKHPVAQLERDNARLTERLRGCREVVKEINAKSVISHAIAPELSATACFQINQLTQRLLTDVLKEDQP